VKDLTIVFDNVAAAPGLTPGWGFAAFIRGFGKTVLFDTGADGPTLLSNMRALSLSPDDIDIVVLSHPHADHAGGLPELLSAAPRAELVAPDAIPRGLREAIESMGRSFRTAPGSEELTAGVVTTGSLPGQHVEQGLVLTGNRGPVLVTGCAHPGLKTMLIEAGRLAGAPVEFAIGGFHWHAFRKGSIRTLAAELKELGLERIAPSHCTGDRATMILADVFGDGFVKSGLGTTIDLGGD
jgi:7,8-dihydropterin-6-yl-methyl-4-(beta-D-ribofuranosyl)aminobenzene 5'-phosphate synthase